MNRKSLNIALLAVSIILLFISISFPQKIGDASKEAIRLEKAIEKRLSLLDEWVEKSTQLSDEDLFLGQDIPSDFILYRYQEGYLVAWHGQLPVQYDEYITKRKRTTLSSVPDNYTYYSFSGASYLIKSVKQGDNLIIAALSLTGNKKLQLESSYVLESLNSFNGLEVKYKGSPLFRIAYESLSVSNPIPANLSWIAYLLFIVSVLIALSAHPSLKNAGASITLLLFFALAAYRAHPVLEGEISHVLSILIVCVICFIVATSLYIVRRDLWGKCKSIWASISTVIVGIGAILFLFWFIYISIYKVIVYTHICLDLYKIWALNLNTLIVYIGLFLLFFSILEIFALLQPFCLRFLKKRIKVFSRINLTIYSVFVSLFCVGTIASVGFGREKILVASWAESLSNARDYQLESHLKLVERQLIRDYHISRAAENESYLPEAKSYIQDKFFYKYLNNYDISLVPSKGSVVTGIESGIQIESGSRFRYAPLPDQRSRYIAAFHYYSAENGQKTMYLILEPKYSNKRTLSMWLYERGSIDVPARYSYAMYKEYERAYSHGTYPYPFKFSKENFDYVSQEDVKFLREGKYLHFVIGLDKEDFMIISRPSIAVGTYMISIVFIAILFYLCVFWIEKRRSGSALFSKNYFRRYMTWLLVLSLTITMSVLAFVSISFVYDRNNLALERMISDKVNTIRFQLQNGLRNVKNPSDLNSLETLELIRRVGDNSGLDISLYRFDGKIVMSTAPELHERHIMSYRMPSEAYYSLRYKNEGFYVGEVWIGPRMIYMLYAPIMNAEGKVVAYFESPYTGSGRDVQFEAVLHAFNVSVVFILLLLITSIVATRMINRTFKPLSQMSHKMRSGVIEKLDELAYKKDDEISDIVHSYNSMVEDLERSTKALAQAERDKAWSEMARNVAHEIKNPLTPMQLQIQRVQRLKAMGDASWQEKFDNMCKVMLDHISILTETANQFSDFAKLYSEEPVRVALDELLKEEISLYDSRADVKFVYLGLPDTYIEAPRPQLVRVFVNLLNNAVQACEGREDARIAVSLRNGVDPRFYEIVFEDNGEGVDEANIDKLFTPKFTTKSSGSGLGLSICANILERCGASITYSRSFSLGGACFTILYPKSS